MKKKLFFIIAIIFLFIFLFPSYSRPLRSGVKKIVLISGSKIYHLGHRTGNFFSMVSSIGKTKKENVELTAENMALKSQIAQMDEIKHQNELLKETLNFKQQTLNTKILTTKVIGHSPVNSIKTMTIAAGEEDDVKIGQTVVSNGFLVGRISAVEKNSATIFQINNASSLVPVLLQSSRSLGLLRGGISGLTVEKIPLDVKIGENENVITSGLGQEFAENITVGTVSKVISKESEIFQKVSVDSPVQFDNLEIVSVLQ